MGRIRRTLIRAIGKSQRKLIAKENALKRAEKELWWLHGTETPHSPYQFKSPQLAFPFYQEKRPRTRAERFQGELERKRTARQFRERIVKTGYRLTGLTDPIYKFADKTAAKKIARMRAKKSKKIRKGRKGRSLAKK